MHAGRPGGLNDGGITGIRVEPGDIVADRPRQHPHRLRQIADLAAQLHGVPLVRRGPVQPDLALIGGHRPHQKPGQRGFAGCRIADHPQPVAGVQGKADTRQDMLHIGPSPYPSPSPTPSPLPGQPGHADLPGGVGQGDRGGRVVLGGKERRKPLMGGLRLAQTAPLADQLIHRPQSPARQDRRGDDHSARDFAQNDKIRPQCQDP